MGRRPEEMFFPQRRHADGQQASEKMLNIINRQGNGNQNHNEMSPHTCQNGHYQKSSQITNIGKDVEKKETLVHSWIVNLCSHHGKHYEGSSKN